MFNSFMSPCSSPCPSPVRELAASIKRVSSPRKQKYKAFIGSKDPIYSKGRLTMTGGFTDFRECCLEKGDSVESNEGGSSDTSGRSDSCDSTDAIIASPSKQSPCLVKIPRKAFCSAVSHLSPKLSKKLANAMQNEKAPEVSKNPMWPNVMNTYGRGVSTSPVQTIMMPLEPSLTAMKAQAILDERRDIRIALQILSYKASLQRQVEANNGLLPHEKEENSSSASSSEEDESEEQQYINYSEQVEQSIANQLEVNVPNPEPFIINPEINIETTDGRIRTPETDEGFHDESLFDALDLDSLPTLTPEELANTSMTEVRNVHLVCDYIVLETGPPSDSVFV